MLSAISSTEVASSEGDCACVEKTLWNQNRLNLPFSLQISFFAHYKLNRNRLEGQKFTNKTYFTCKIQQISNETCKIDMTFTLAFCEGRQTCACADPQMRILKCYIMMSIMMQIKKMYIECSMIMVCNYHNGPKIYTGQGFKPTIQSKLERFFL